MARPAFPTVSPIKRIFMEKEETPQQACGITYLNLFTQVGFLSAL
jgi:hypothetical protein